MVHKEAKRCFRNGGSDFSLPLEVDTSLNGAGFRRQKVNLISLFPHVTLPPSAVRDGFILIFLHPFVTLWRLANRRQGFSGSRAGWGWGMVIDFPLHLLHLAWQFEMAHAKHIITPSDIVSQTDCPLCVDIVIISWCSAFACRKKCVTRKHLFLLSKKTSAFPISYRREVFFFPFLVFKTRARSSPLPLPLSLVWFRLNVELLLSTSGYEAPASRSSTTDKGTKGLLQQWATGQLFWKVLLAVLSVVWCGGSYFIAVSHWLLSSTLLAVK